MYFIGNIVWEDYKVIGEMKDDMQFIKTYDQSGKFLRNLRDEKSISIILLKDIPGFDRTALMEARNQTDDGVKKISDLIQSNHIKIDNTTLKDLFKPFIEKTAQLQDLRKQIDSRSIDPNDAGTYFDEIESQLFVDLYEMARSIHDLTLARTLFAYLNLLHEGSAISFERRVLFEAFSKGELSGENLEILLLAHGQQLTYRTIFFELGTREQDEVYNKAMQGQVTIESDRILQGAISSAGEKINQTPSKWWDLQARRLSQLMLVEEKLVDESIARVEEIRFSKIFELYSIIILVALALSIATLLVILSLKAIVKRLQEEIVILSTAGNEIKSSITEASSGTSETAASVTETTTTVEELKQTAQVAAEKAKKVAEVSNDAINILNTGERNLEKTIEGMMHIQNGMSTISESIIKLSEHSQSIGKIIDTVNELAEQSHLLAVNAAIEAAKAGEQGKGFSVVAQEVRSLAEQSKQATIQVRNILNDIQNSTSAAVMATEQGTKAVNNGVEMSNQIGVSIQSLSEGINKVSEASSQIALSSEQQLIGVSQVNVAMTNIREATEKHVEHMHLIENAIEGMNTVGQSLKDLVTKF